MKRVKYFCGNYFTKKTVDNFIKENFFECELEFSISTLLCTVYSDNLHLPKNFYDSIIIGDHIKLSDTPLDKPGYFSPIVLRDFIVAGLGYSPRICFFSNPYDYIGAPPFTEEHFSKDFEKSNLYYINNLEDDAFAKLYDFINSL